MFAWWESLTVLNVLLLWAVLCQDWGETASLQHPSQAAWRPKTRPLQRRWVWSHARTLMPAHSRHLPLSHAVCLSEEESEEDEADIVSREALKRQSQLIIDSRSKKKSWKKKKGKFWSNSSLKTSRKINDLNQTLTAVWNELTVRTHKSKNYWQVESEVLRSLLAENTNENIFVDMLKDEYMYLCLWTWLIVV